MKLPRPLKFFLLRWAGLPLGLAVFRVLSWTWRFGPDAQEAVELAARQERLIVGALHGTLAALIPAAKMFRKTGRQLAGMTSPSRDGLVFDILLRKLGVRVVKGSSSSKAVEGARELAKALREGCVGYHTVDGPRGPRGVPKPGALRLAKAANAKLYCLSVGASSAWVFKSWDRLFIPKPFARITLRMAPFEFQEGESEEAMLERFRLLLLQEGRAAGSPCVEGLADPQA